MVLFSLLGFIFEPKLTYDNLLALAVGGIIFLLNWARLMRKRKRTFDLQYPVGTYKSPEEMSKKNEVGIGEGEILLRIHV